MTGAFTPVNALAAVTAAIVLAVLLIVARRAIRMARMPVHEAAEAEARRLLFSLLAGDPQPRPAARRLRTAEPLAFSLLPKLRGADRDALVRLLEESGALNRARRDIRRRGAVRRATAAELLGAAQDVGSLPGLATLLCDRHNDVRIVAARAIGKLGAGAVVPLLSALEGPRTIPSGVVTMALVHVGTNGLPGLRDALASAPSDRARTVAAKMLGQLADYASAGRLIEALAGDPSPDVRTAAAHSLGMLGVAPARGALASGLHTTTDPELRLACAQALGKVGGAEALELLPNLLRSADHRIARAAANGLANCGAAGVRALERAAAAPDHNPAARERLAQLALGSRALAEAA